MAKRSSAASRRPHWTEADARRVLADWSRSGASLEAFARSRGLVPQRLAWWRKRLRAARAEASTTLTLVPGTPGVVQDEACKAREVWLTGPSDGSRPRCEPRRKIAAVGGIRSGRQRPSSQLANQRMIGVLVEHCAVNRLHVSHDQIVHAIGANPPELVERVRERAAILRRLRQKREPWRDWQPESRPEPANRGPHVRVSLERRVAAERLEDREHIEMRVPLPFDGERVEDAPCAVGLAQRERSQAARAASQVANQVVPPFNAQAALCMRTTRTSSGGILSGIGCGANTTR